MCDESSGFCCLFQQKKPAKLVCEAGYTGTNRLLYKNGTSEQFGFKQTQIFLARRFHLSILSSLFVLFSSFSMYSDIRAKHFLRC